jgi:hypothetical protein
MIAAASPCRCTRLILAAATIGAACGEAGYKSRLRSVEAEFTSHNTVATIQAWLAQRATQAPATGATEWPALVRKLDGRAVWARQCDGVSISIVRLEVFTLTVCPPGRRPPMPFHEPSQSQPGYLGPFGTDAYISMIER